MPRPARRSYLGLVSADAPDAATARVHLLCTGASRGRLASTVGFIRDGDTTVIIDPGMVADREHILAPLAELGEQAGSPIPATPCTPRCSPTRVITTTRRSTTTISALPAAVMDS